MHDRPGMMAAILVGAVVAGIICGLMPLCVGQKLGRRTEGIAGFALCVVSAFFGGLLLAVPLALAISLALFVLGPSEEPLVKSREFDLAAHEERVATLRALALARKERTDLPLPSHLPEGAGFEHAIQAGVPPQPQGIRRGIGDER